MRSVFLFITCLVFSWTNLVKAQISSVFGTYQSVDEFGGSIEINLGPDTSFSRIDRGGNSVIDNEGSFEVKSDTIFFTYTQPSIINAMDTFTNEGHFAFRKDTLWRTGDNELSDRVHLFSNRYYRKEAWNETGQIIARMEWETFDTIYNGNGNNSYFIPNRQRPHGTWTYFDNQGIALKREMFVHGKRKKY